LKDQIFKSFRLFFYTPKCYCSNEKVYIIGGNKIDASDNTNNFVEALDTMSGMIVNASNQFLPLANGGLSYACLIALPEDDAFVVTGGEIYALNGS
jgi:hypothetical protein